jgi:hypothetical protein
MKESPQTRPSDYRVVEFLRTRIADADFLTASEKHLLGRGPAPWLSELRGDGHEGHLVVRLAQARRQRANE